MYTSACWWKESFEENKKKNICAISRELLTFRYRRHSCFFQKICSLQTVHFILAWALYPLIRFLIIWKRGKLSQMSAKKINVLNGPSSCMIPPALFLNAGWRYRRLHSRSFDGGVHWQDSLECRFSNSYHVVRIRDQQKPMSISRISLE